MKKFNKLLITVAALFSIVLTSCKDPVFYYISKDVRSEEATINGYIRSIARYDIGGKQYLFTISEDGLIYKTTDASNSKHGTWSTLGESKLPFKLIHYDHNKREYSGQQLLKVVSDATNLYILTVSYDVDFEKGITQPTEVSIWKCNATTGIDEINSASWTKVNVDLTNAIYNPGDYYYTAVNIFCTNSTEKVNRKAYVRIGGGAYQTEVDRKYYKLDNLSEVSITAFEDSTNGTDVNINGVAAYGSDVKFFKTSAVTTNDDDSIIYWGQGSTLYYSMDGETKQQSAGVGKTIVSLAACSDTVLIGCGEVNSTSTSAKGGIEKVQLDAAGEPASSLGTFTTNAQTQLLKSYVVGMLFNTDPSEKEVESSLYASLYFPGTGTSSAVSYNNVGLWSYYPGRGNWNRE